MSTKMKKSANIVPNTSFNKSQKKSEKSRSKGMKPENNTRNATSGQVTTSSITTKNSTKRKSKNKGFAVFDAETVEIIWEQHNTSDIELSVEVPQRLAEDVSYKIWDVVNHIKTFSRHSGGKVTCDLVNEVLKDCDVPTIMGTTTVDWDIIDHDGCHFYQSDKIIELRDEYQKDVAITIPFGSETEVSRPVERWKLKRIKNFIPNLMYACVYGDVDVRSEALELVAVSPQIGNYCRVLLDEVLQYLAFKQSDIISERCWRVLQAMAFNPYSSDVDSREEFFHLAEILVCQLMAPYETVRIHKMKNGKSTLLHKSEEANTAQNTSMHEEIEKESVNGETMSSEAYLEMDKIYKLQTEDNSVEPLITFGEDFEISSYFAYPVSSPYVHKLCETIGKLAAKNSFFQNEFRFLVLRKLKNFFEDTFIAAETDYECISRSIRGLISLGEYSFRELIPYIYNLPLDNLPDQFLVDFARTAVFIQGRIDIFLYEWLEDLCGDKLQPFMLHYAHFQHNLAKNNLRKRDTKGSKVPFKVCFRRVKLKVQEHQKVLTNFSISDMFPEKQNINCKNDDKIRFNLSACQQVRASNKSFKEDRKTSTDCKASHTIKSKDIVLATRTFCKPLSIRCRTIHQSSFYFLQL